MAAARAEPVEAGKDDDCRGAQGRRASASSTCVAGTVAAKAKQVWTPARCAWGASGWGWRRAARGAMGGGGARMGSQAGGASLEGIGSGGWVGWDRLIESGMGGWLGLVQLWAAGLYGPNCWVEKWVFNIFRVVRVIRVPGVYTRITRNKLGFLEVLPEIGIGYFGLG